MAPAYLTTSPPAICLCVSFCSERLGAVRKNGFGDGLTPEVGFELSLRLRSRSAISFQRQATFPVVSIWVEVAPLLATSLVSSSIVAIMLQLLGLPSLILSTRLFVTNLEATVLYAQVLVLVAAITWSAGTSL